MSASVPAPPSPVPSAPAVPMSERQLAELWCGGRFPSGALVTRHGVPVRVIHQGRPGRGPGPDFRGASISGPSGIPLHGDIELHVRSSSFRAHGHHADAAYANVILHVVFEDDTGADTPLCDGGSAPVVALAPWVARRAEELQQWLARPLLWREPCHDALMRMGASGVAAALESEGDRRFGARVARLRQKIAASGLEQALYYEGLLEALGYGGNGPQMLALARLLPWKVLASRSDGADRIADALLLGSAGLLPSQRSHRGPVDGYVADLEQRFAKAALPSLPPGLWKLWGIRPQNAPARRVASASALLIRLGTPSAALGILDASSVSESVAPLLLAASGYWRDHHDLWAAPTRLPGGLIGRSRALELIINSVLPAAAASGDPELALKARLLYAKLPRPATYGITRFIENSLASEGMRLPVTAHRAQGLLALNRDWCTKNGCGRCPLS